MATRAPIEAPPPKVTVNHTRDLTVATSIRRLVTGNQPPGGWRPIGALLTALALAAPAASAGLQQESVDELVGAVLQAYGGRSAVLAVRSYRMEATVDALSRGERGQVTRTATAPAALTVLVRYASASELRVVEGNTGRRGTSPDDLVPVQGPLLGSMIVQAARAHLPWILDARRADVRLAERGSAGDVVELPLQQGLRLQVTIDRRSRLITRTVGLVPAGPTEIRFQTDFSDFRKVSGVLFPFHEENHASGVHTGTTIVTSVLVNPPADRIAPRHQR